MRQIPQLLERGQHLDRDRLRAQRAVFVDAGVHASGLTFAHGRPGHGVLRLAIPVQGPRADLGERDGVHDPVAVGRRADEAEVDLAHHERRAIVLDHLLDRVADDAEQLVLGVVEPGDDPWIVHEPEGVRLAPVDRDLLPVHGHDALPPFARGSSGRYTGFEDSTSRKHAPSPDHRRNASMYPAWQLLTMKSGCRAARSLKPASTPGYISPPSSATSLLSSSWVSATSVRMCASGRPAKTSRMHWSCGLPVTRRTSCSVIGRKGMPCRWSTRFHPTAHVAEVSHSVPSRSNTTESITG